MRTINLVVLFLLCFALYGICEFKGVRGYYHGLPCLISAFLLVRYKLKLAAYF